MFETINDSDFLQPVLEQGWTQHMINREIAMQYRLAALNRLNQGDFNRAKLAFNQQIMNHIRNDSIFWLDEDKNLTEFENAILHNLTQAAQSFKDYLRMPISDFECHWAYYPKGHFYKKHKDTTEFNNKRILSFVLYLNEIWSESDGGENVGYSSDQVLWKIEPTLGQLLIFRSDFEHEVLPTNKDRLSLTGWFRSL